jgi:two-component system, OmpR family, phosphate regulon response regulator OmpR
LENLGEYALKKIVYIDDDLLLGELLVSRLEASGYEALAFSDTRIALDQIGQILPDLVVIDKIMDNLANQDGIDISKEIRKLLPGIKIILLSGLIEDIDRERGKVAGIDQFVTKPFNPEQFLQLIADLLKE